MAGLLLKGTCESCELLQKEEPGWSILFTSDTSTVDGTNHFPLLSEGLFNMSDDFWDKSLEVLYPPVSSQQ